MADDDCSGLCGVAILGSFFTFIILLIVFGCLYTAPNLPEFSIEEFSVPAFNKTSDLDQMSVGDIYFDLKLRNMNKAIGLYYDDPSNIAFIYNPPQDPYQKYAWVSNFSPFYQGNGKTKHIRTTVDVGNDNRLQLPSSSHIQLPSSTVVVVERAEVPVVIFRINLFVTYRFKLLWDSATHELEVGADVMVYAHNGERVSKGRIKLV